MEGWLESSGATVTVIFADVEGSTALLERLGQARWLKALAEYEEHARPAASTRTGARSSRRWATVTCSPSRAPTPRCAAPSTSSARCRSTAAPDLRVRMGLHTGEPVALEDDLHGRTVVKAARIADLAHGGEVLVSGIVRELAETDADLEDEIWFEESREVELRGLRGRHLVLAAQWQREDRGPIRVVIADDSAIVRDGVAALLRECGVHVAGLATDPESLYREIERHRPDVALVDIRMPPTGHQRGPRRRRAHRSRVPRGRRPRPLPVPGARLRPAPRRGPGGAARLPDQGPRRRDRDAARRGAPGRQRRLRGRPGDRRAPGDAGPGGRPAGRALRARARGPGAHRRGPLRRGDRRAPRDHARGGRDRGRTRSSSSSTCATRAPRIGEWPRSSPTCARP